VFTSALGLSLGALLFVYSFGVFFKSLVHDFHASRAAVSLAFTLHNVVAALCLPATGRLMTGSGRGE